MKSSTCTTVYSSVLAILCKPFFFLFGSYDDPLLLPTLPFSFSSLAVTLVVLQLRTPPSNAWATGGGFRNPNPLNVSKGGGDSLPLSVGDF